MKEVITGEELKKIMVDAINLLCDSVSSTLGPSGNNVLINTDDVTPYITNDGVTIAEAIESSDKRINTILEIAKEASLKTNEEVGDGTTTTLVLLQSLIHEGLKEIENGKNPIILKQELNEVLDKALEELDKLKKDATDSDLLNVAINSSEDIKVGNILTEIYLKMGSRYACRLTDANTDYTYYDIKKGYNLEIDNIPSIYFEDNKELNLKDSYVLLLKGYLSDLEMISDIINEGLNRNKNIVILASEYDIEIEREVLLYYLQEHKNIYLFKIPDYASRKEAITKDIATLTKANIKDINLERVTFNDLGKSDITITKNELTIISDNDISNRLNNLKEELNNTNDDYEKEFLQARISKLENGIATIYVGGKTKSEIKEKIMHYEDALCSLEIAKFGIVTGEGIPFLSIINKLSLDTTGANILKKALEVPFNKIMENSASDKDEIKKEIEESNYQKIYNFNTKKYESINETKIIDPLKVITTALKNAVSIASLLLTTNYLVINEKIEVEKSHVL